jgi:uncharacterized protein DUF4189
MKSIFVAVLGSAVVFSSAAFAGWGATALNESTGASGESHGYPNRGAAIGAAIRACGAGCRMINWEHNSCVALATNGSGRWGESHGLSDRGSAQRRALAACGAGCTIKEWACN